MFGRAASLLTPVALGLASCTSEPRDDRPDVVLIVMDTTRQDRLGPYAEDAAPSPFFDRLESQAVVFDNAWTASSWTAPSSATIHTGLHPQRHGVIECLWAQVGAKPEGSEIFDVLAKVDLVAMPSGIETLGEHLAAAGYRGIGVAANPNICKELGFARGFESFTYEDDVDAATLVSRFQASESQGDPEQPVFAYFHLNDPHAPYEKHEAYCPHVSLGGECSIDCWYQSEIEYAGAQLGSLFDEMGWWEDAIIVFVNDHGEEFSDHGRQGHKFSLHPELCRAPLLVSAPGLTPRRTSLPAHQVDLLPTILNLVGLPQPAVRDGVDLLAESAGADVNRPILSHRSEPKSGKSGKELWSLLIGDWRLTEEYPAGTRKLYEIARDPTERNDVAAIHPERVESMSARLAAIKGSLEPLPRNEVQFDLTYRLNMELKKLGYTDKDN